MKILKLKNNKIDNKLKKILRNRYESINNSLDRKVKEIIIDVKKNGDKALKKYTKKFDKVEVDVSKINLNSIKLNKQSKIEPKVLKSFKKAIKNITKFHLKQLPSDIIQNENSILLKSQWKPIDSVGLYIPGGKAFYPSSLIMNVIPAKTLILFFLIFPDECANIS